MGHGADSAGVGYSTFCEFCTMLILTQLLFPLQCEPHAPCAMLHAFLILKVIVSSSIITAKKLKHLFVF
jgi:hypothetical protein